MIDHPNAKSMRTRVQTDGKSYLTIVEVETDLALNLGNPISDSAAYHVLVGACLKYFEDNAIRYDRLDVVEAWNNA